MRGPVLMRFEYEARPRCVCGELLGGGVRREFDHPWGQVVFERCGACASWLQAPQIRADSLARWYDSAAYRGSSREAGAGYHDYFADEANRLVEARARASVDLLGLVPPPADALEIGCATGSQLAALVEYGYRVHGIDLAAEFVEFARERYALDVYCGDFLTAPVSESTFDLVLMYGTLSNLPDPDAQLERVARVLRPGGVLATNLPLADSLTARVFGRRYWMFTPSVSSFMSRRGVRSLLERTGLVGIEIRQDWQQPSWGKLLHHARLGHLLRAARVLGWAEKRLPTRLPIPGVALALARRALPSSREHPH
ncbi:MAG: class I SAM-dependent methyltransferase [Gammaproteobacteria bacterium]